MIATLFISIAGCQNQNNKLKNGQLPRG